MSLRWLLGSNPGQAKPRRGERGRSFSVASIASVALAVSSLGGLEVGTASAGSLFGAEGLGLPRSGYDLAARGAGSTSIGLIDPFQSSVLNPGALGWTNRPQLYSGLFTESTWITTSATSSSDRVGGTRLAGVRAAVPISRLRFAAGFSDVTDARYSLDVLENDGQPDEYVRHAEGTGGLSELYGEVAVPIGTVASVGFRYAALGGTLREVREDLFTNSEFTVSESVLRTRLERGRTFTFGAQARPHASVGVGAYFGWGDDAALKSIYRSGSGLTSEERLKFELPPTFGFGASVQVSPRWVVAFDLSETRWSESKTTLGRNAGNTSLDNLTDDRHFGVGLRRLGSPEPSNRVSSRTIWRAGFRWDELGLPDRGDPIQEWALTGGVGLPIQLDRGYIDLLLEFGQRGDDATVGLRETFARLGVGATFQELRRAF